MSLTPRSFRPEEIGDADTTIRDGELAAAYAAARLLEQAMPIDHMRLSSDFSDRVMAAVAFEPAPRAAGFLAGVMARPGPRSLLASVREAWTTVAGASGRPFGVRAAALAYVLVVLIGAASVTGAVAVGTVGALNFLSGDQSPVASQSVASPSPSPDQTDAIQPSGPPEPSESAGPSESPGVEASSGPGETPTTQPSNRSGPTPSPNGSDDQPSTSPSSSDDHGGDSGSPTDSPRPSETPH